jgi:hypothetical protein
MRGMKRIIASMVLIVIGLVCACSVYFEPRPRDGLKAEELVAIDFCHFSGWIIFGVGAIVGATALNCPETTKKIPS